MVKTLENNILKSKIKRVKAGILALASLVFFGCEPIITTTNYAPKESISSSQSSTKVGTSIYLNADGTDENGIANHLIALDNNSNGIIDAGDLELIKQDSPIKNYSWTPTKAGTYSFIAQGTDNLDLSLKGTARLEIVALDDVINPPVNYAPVITSSPILTVEEGNSYNYQVTVNYPEGDNLTCLVKPSWLSANQINSSTWLVSGSPPAISADTNEDVGIDVSDGTNTTKQNYTLTEKNLLDITGNLQDVETLTNSAGEVRIYDGTTLLSDINSSDGNFSFHASSPVAQVKLQARFNKVGGAETSYIRTLTLDGTKDQDLTNKIRVSRYGYSDGSFFDATDFKNSMGEINFGQGYFPNKDGLKKSITKNVQILKQNPLTNNSADSFDNAKIGYLIDEFTSPTGIRKFIGGEAFQNVIDDSLVKHYTIANGFIIPDEGWVIEVPNSNVKDMYGNAIAGKTTNFYLNGTSASGIINRSIIEIRPEHAVYNDPVGPHEFGHVFIAPNGEAKILATLSTDKTIMIPAWDIVNPGVADEKAGKIIYENTYLPREKLDDILGMNWMN
mgnify:FL=1